MSTQADHVHFDIRSQSMRCEHCGTEDRLELPLSVQLVAKRTRAFLRKHRKCAPKPPQKSDQNRKPPALPHANPCGSCPYRRDVPAGIWHPSEYSKLPAYDRETFAQPTRAFFCHSQDGTVCAGWLASHGPWQLLAVRLGVGMGHLSPGCASYETSVPVFESGKAAARHGLAGVAKPGPKAVELIGKLSRLTKRQKRNVR